MVRIFLTVVFLLGWSCGFAQKTQNLYTLASPYERYTHNVVTLRWTGSQPLGSFAGNYIDKFSGLNYSAQLEWMLKDFPLSVGAEIGQDYFKKRLPRAIYSSGDQDISAIQTRTMRINPIQVAANYYFLPVNAAIRPYAGISAGVGLVNYVNYWGSLSDQSQKAGFSYGAQAGVKVLFGKEGHFGLDLRARYNKVNFKFDYVDNGVPSIGASVGAFYRWW